MYVYLVIYSIILSVLSLDKAYRNEDRNKTKYIYIYTAGTSPLLHL